LAKEKLPKVAAALKYLAPHGTGDAKSLATHVCGMVGDLYSGKMPDFNPTLLGGEIWNNLLMELEPETTAKKSPGKKLAYAGIIALLIGAGAYGAYRMMNDTPRNRFIDSAKAKGATADEAGRIYDGMYKAAMSDRQITIDRNGVLSDTAQSMLDLGIVSKHPTMDTLHGLGNMTVAYKQLGLPALGRDATWLLTNATQTSPHTFSKTNPDIFDPTPFVSKSMNADTGSNVTITPVPALQAWTTADQLKAITDNGLDILNHPKMFAGLNGKIIAELFCGSNNYKVMPDSQDYKDLTLLQWKLSLAPLTRNGDFPWDDSEKLKAMYNTPERVEELKADLFGRFYLPRGGYSLKDNKVVYGIRGAMIGLQQAYDGITTASYPNGTLRNGEDPRLSYYIWLGDRYEHGLKNTVGRFIDDPDVPLFGSITNTEWAKMVRDNNGHDGYLTKNWKYWDLVKFLSGYFRDYYGGGGGGDDETAGYLIPAALRMANFPLYHVNIEPTPGGAVNREWAVGLPPGIADSLKKTDALFGPGYTFGLYNSGKSALTSDGIKEVYVFDLCNETNWRDNIIYLMK